MKWLSPLRALYMSIAFVTLCCVGAAVFLMAAVFGEENNQPAVNLAGCGETVPVDPAADLPGIRDLDEEQVQNAAIIIAVGQGMEVPPRGWVIAIATALQESTLHNYGHLGDRNDHDSLGLFQQRPSMGWGTPEQLQDPEYASTKFYEKMLQVDGWEDMRLTVVAQTVQRSAFPDAYAKWEPLAVEVVNVLTEGGGRVLATGGQLGECADGEGVSASGWIAPVQEGIVSGYRTAQRPDHDGVDLGSPRGTEVLAASSGVVITSECNAFAPNGSPMSCDVDGSPQVRGCGWYVNILHAEDVLTRYCHFQYAPEVRVGDTVSAGDVIGYVGTSGNSSGPHLHYEVHLNGDRSSAGAIDPVGWMEQVGAPLGEG